MDMAKEKATDMITEMVTDSVSELLKVQFQNCLCTDPHCHYD